MLFDKENMFFDGEDASGFAGGKDSGTVYNQGGGDAIIPLYLAVLLTGGSGQLDVAVQTSDSEGMGDAATIATFSSPSAAKGLVVKQFLPYGCKKYIRLNIKGTATGKVTAGLTDIVPVE